MAVWQNSPAPTPNLAPSHGLAEDLKVAVATVAVTTALAAADTINFFELPDGAVIHSARLQPSTPLDTNGAPTLTLNVGWSGSAAALYSASTGLQSLAGDSNPLFAGLETQLLGSTLIFGTVQAAGATKAAGSVRLRVEYTVEGHPS